MKTYSKIQTAFKRDPETKFKTLLIGDFACSEFEYLKNNNWIWTEKVDGTNIRVMWDGEKIEYGGKTDRAELKGDLIENLHKLFDNKIEYLKKIFIPSEGEKVNVCLYGEGYGAGIQKGGKYRQDKGFVLFDIKIGDWWLQRCVIETMASGLNIDIVPVIGKGTLIEMIDLVKKGFNSRWGDFIAEGIVAKPEVELLMRNKKRIITKLKHKDFDYEK